MKAVFETSTFSVSKWLISQQEFIASMILFHYLLIHLGNCHLTANFLIKNISRLLTSIMYRDADKSLARPGRKQATATKL